MPELSRRIGVTKPRSRRLVAAGILAVGFLLPIGCKNPENRAKGRTTTATSAENLPQLVIKDDSTGLTFSYVTLKGGFLTATRVNDVPYEARDAVRVWSDLSGDGISGPYIYVADLRGKLPDGTYKVDVQPRAEFEKLAEARRGKAAANPSSAVGSASKEPSASLASVIIYGASWCRPCHDVEKYLTSKSVPFVHKDIEADELANEEMSDKLTTAGIRTRNIPVIDVGGTILVGFNPGELDRALAATRKKG